MLAVIWMTLLCSTTGASNSTNKACTEPRSSVTLTERHITAQAGACVIFKCSVENPSTLKSIAWYKCNPPENCNEIVFNCSKNEMQSNFSGRVSLLEFDQNKKSCSIMIINLTLSDSGLYQVRVTGKQNNDCTSKGNVTLTVLNQKPTLTIPPLIEGKQTTLNCTAPDLCFGSKPEFRWMWRGAQASDTQIRENITDSGTENLTAVTQRHRSTLSFNVSAEHHNTEVTCKVSFTGGTATEETRTLEVNFPPVIFDNPTCDHQSEVLKCVCVSKGIPLPTISWLLDRHSDYFVTTTVSNPTVTSTLTVPVKGHNSTTVWCVSRNDQGEVKKNATVSIKQQDDLLEQLKKFLTTLQEPIIVLTTGILIGIFFSTIVTCLVIKCHRKKKSRNLVEDLEMVTTQTVPKVENDGIHDVEAAEGEAEFADLLVPDDDMVPEEIEYSNIDFFALKKRDSTEAEEKQKTTETEYAEINTGGTENRQKDGEEDSEMLVGENADQVMINEDDEAKENKLAEDVENRQKDGEEDSEMLVGEDADQVMINEDDEAKENKLAEDAVGEDFHRYSSVKDILDESVDE